MWQILVAGVGIRIAVGAGRQLHHRYQNKKLAKMLANDKRQLVVKVPSRAIPGKPFMINFEKRSFHFDCPQDKCPGDLVQLHISQLKPVVVGSQADQARQSSASLGRRGRRQSRRERRYGAGNQRNSLAIQSIPVAEIIEVIESPEDEENNIVHKDDSSTARPHEGSLTQQGLNVATEVSSTDSQHVLELVVNKDHLINESAPEMREFGIINVRAGTHVILEEGTLENGLGSDLNDYIEIRIPAENNRQGIISRFVVTPVAMPVAQSIGTTTSFIIA